MENGGLGQALRESALEAAQARTGSGWLGRSGDAVPASFASGLAHRGNKIRRGLAKTRFAGTCHGPG
eukprot:6543154-Alexandrium_andersonii.AAC.1